MTVDLQRFVDAQRDSFERALCEIEAGRKRSHWMWYIFPQIRGLGLSAISQRYAIESVDEAEAYLQHAQLGRGYLRLVDAVWHQVIEQRVAIDTLFGAPDDAKLVSSLTLFAGVADRLDGSQPPFTTFVARAREILRAADAEGLSPCTTTERFVTG